MFKNFPIDDLYWALKFGKSKRRASIYDIRTNNFTELKQPIFFLSTGRTGTKWFTELFSKKNDLMLLHSERPDFGIQNKYIYNLFSKNIDDELLQSIINEIFLVGREQYIRYSYKTDKQIIETNNHVTFMAYALSNLFPNSKFIHLYRHPGEFVRSGLRRDWYADKNAFNHKLIEPNNNNNADWNNYDKIQKISWLWNETNKFIIKFGESISSERFYSFNFNNLTHENVINLLKFMDIEISDALLNKQLNIKSNVQKSGTYPKYNEWTIEDKNKLIDICSETSSKLGYEL